MDKREVRLVTGAPSGSCEVRVAYKEEEELPCRKVPPPMWTQMKMKKKNEERLHELTNQEGKKKQEKSTNTKVRS